MDYPSELAQHTINQRLKFLIKALDMTVRAFSTAIDVPESSTRNYLDKGTKLNAEYIEKIAHHFKSVSLNWLITGEGQPLLSTDAVAEPSATFIKKNSGNSIGTNRGTATQNQTLADHDCAIKLEAAQQLIEQLKSQLQDKEHIIQLLSRSAK